MQTVLKNNFVKIEHARKNYLLYRVQASKWYNSYNHNLLDKESWESAKREIIENSDTIIFDDEADILGTKHFDDKISYHINLGYIINDTKKFIDIYVDEIDKYNKKVCSRKIDANSINSKELIESINNSTVKNCYTIKFAGADRLFYIGSINWKNGTDKTNIKSIQKKLNSEINEGEIADVATEMRNEGYNIEVKSRDEFGNFLYCGSPGNITDFIICCDGISDKVDAKVLDKLDKSYTDKLFETGKSNIKQAHDGKCCICTNYHRDTGYKTIVVCEDGYTSPLLQSSTFNEFMNRLNTRMKTYAAKGNLFIGINEITSDSISGYRF